VAGMISAGQEHPLAQQVKLGPALHLAFDQLGPAHLPFDLS
jgi:hypothetical protein